MNLVVLVAVPPAVVTLMGPVVAPPGTEVVIDVAGFPTVKVAVVPLNLTDVAPVKLLPESFTLCPMAPLGGVKALMVGSGMTVKFTALFAVPPAVMTAIFPVVAPPGTEVLLTTLNVDAAVPLNFTVVAPVKFIPVSVTLCPMGPLLGMKALMVGATIKFVLLVAVPPAVVTVMGPLVAPTGIVSVMTVTFRVTAALTPLIVAVGGDAR